MKTKQELNDLLREGQVVVEFKKKDGEVRKMICTKSFDIIPSDKHPKTVSETKEGGEIADLFNVWDMEKEGWRSFDYKTLIKIGDDNNDGANSNVIGE